MEDTWKCGEVGDGRGRAEGGAGFPGQLEVELGGELLEQGHRGLSGGGASHGGEGLGSDELLGSGVAEALGVAGTRE